MSPAQKLLLVAAVGFIERAAGEGWGVKGQDGETMVWADELSLAIAEAFGLGMGELDPALLLEKLP